MKRTLLLMAVLAVSAVGPAAASAGDLEEDRSLFRLLFHLKAPPRADVVDSMPVRTRIAEKNDGETEESGTRPEGSKSVSDRMSRLEAIVIGLEKVVDQNKRELAKLVEIVKGLASKPAN